MTQSMKNKGTPTPLLQVEKTLGQAPSALKSEH